MKTTITRRKTEVIFDLKDFPEVDDQFTGLAFKPTKAVYTDFGDRAGIQLYNPYLRSANFRVPGKATYNVHGYPKRPPSPEWLLRMLGIDPSPAPADAPGSAATTDSERGAGEIFQVLDKHLLRDTSKAMECSCGEWSISYREVMYPEQQHRAHVAAELEKMLHG